MTNGERMVWSVAFVQASAAGMQAVVAAEHARVVVERVRLAAQLARKPTIGVDDQTVLMLDDMVGAP